MKGFLEEYGLIIVVVTVILIMVLLGTGVGDAITTNIQNVIKQLFDTANDFVPTPPAGFGMIPFLF